MIMLLFYISLVVLGVTFAKCGPAAIKACLPRAKELPFYDKFGFRSEYDPHYTRQKEIETGVAVTELTTCSDAACRTCHAPSPDKARTSLGAVRTLRDFKPANVPDNATAEVKVSRTFEGMTDILWTWENPVDCRMMRYRQPIIGWEVEAETIYAVSGEIIDRVYTFTRPMR